MGRGILRRLPLSKCILVSAHAVDRWVERIRPADAGDRPAAVAGVLRLLQDATQIAETEFYNNGVIIAVVGNTVTSVYKARDRSKKLKVRKALRQARNAEKPTEDY